MSSEGVVPTAPEWLETEVGLAVAVTDPVFSAFVPVAAVPVGFEPELPVESSGLDVTL